MLKVAQCVEAPLGRLQAVIPGQLNVCVGVCVCGYWIIVCDLPSNKHEL